MLWQSLASELQYDATDATLADKMELLLLNNYINLEFPQV